EKKRLRWTNLRDMHELYCAGHLFQAAIAYHRSTGEKELLTTAVRFADHIASVFGPGKRRGTPGHPEIEMALVELYRETRKEEYLELAQFFLDQRGYGLIGGSIVLIDHKPFRQLDEIVGHAVRAIYLCCGATDIFMETGERELYETLEKLWKNMVYKRMYVTGGVGSRHAGEAFGDDYELPNRRAYSETCASVANVMWNWRMLLATGESRFTDIMELALYNAALAGISLNGREYFYVNPLADRGRHRRQRWFGCACCPPNIARLLASVPGMIYSTSDNAIWVHLYVASVARIELKGNEVRITQETEYPWDGRIDVTVEPSKDDEFSLYLRIPGWCRAATVNVNGRKVRKSVKPSTYLEISRVWGTGDRVEIELDMPVTLLKSHPYVLNNNYRVAIKRGPVVYCLEQADNPEYDVWNIAIVPETKFTATYEPELLGGVVVIEGNGIGLDISAWNNKLYAEMDEVQVKAIPVKFKAVPYYAWANRSPGPMIVWIQALGFNTLQGGKKLYKA
ncbi:MAG: glycoside hydrolase family 127 protein, partial [Thermoprotei archaeon]